MIPQNTLTFIFLVLDKFILMFIWGNMQEKLLKIKPNTEPYCYCISTRSSKVLKSDNTKGLTTRIHTHEIKEWLFLTQLAFTYPIHPNFTPRYFPKRNGNVSPPNSYSIVFITANAK